MATASFGNIGPYEAGKTESWDEYCERLDQFFIANDVSDPAKKKAIFLSVVGGETYGKLRSLVAPQKPGDMALADLLSQLQRHFEPRPSETVARFRFFTCCRAEGQSVQDYIAKLRKLSEHCNFGSFLSNMIRDRLICGVNADNIQTRLLSEAGLTLTRATEIAVALEAAGHDVQELKSGYRDRAEPARVSASGVDRVDRNHRGTTEADCCRIAGGRGGRTRQVTGFSDAAVARKPSKSAFSGSSRTDSKYRCWRCLSGQHLERNCPFKTKRCFECSNLGHTRAAHKAGTVHIVEEQLDWEPDTAIPQPVEDECLEDVLDLFTCRSLTRRPPIAVKVSVNGKSFSMELDTGASASLISEQLYDQMWPGGSLPLQACSQRFRTYTGEEISVKGVAEVDVSAEGAEPVRLRLMVVQGRGPSLFGRNWLEKIRLDWNTLLSKCSVNTVTAMLDVEGEFPLVFQEGLGRYTGGLVSLHQDESVKPRFFKARPVPLARQQKVEEELKRLEDAGIIRPVSHSEWAAPIVVVPKNNGELRICGDFRLTVNKASALEQYPLPKVDELLTKLSGCSVFSKLDLRQAYNQVELDAESQKLATINTSRGLYSFVRLAFGIHSAPGIFQRIMTTLLAGIPHVTVFLDDVLVGGQSVTEHDKALREVLRRMTGAGLRLNKKKCSFRVDQVTYLGYRISGRGVQPTSDKQRAILEAPAPKDLSQLRSWLGLLNYYSKFLKGVSSVLSPLYRMLRKGEKWTWGPEENAAFNAAKRLILDPPCLAHFYPDRETVLACDASPYGLGCVLSQVDQLGRERPVAFYSRTLSDTERRYAQTDREGLAIIAGVKKFHYFLCGRRFTIETDHKPLLGLLGESKPLPLMASARVQRWAMLLSAYNYQLMYSPASQQTHCDALSRLPLPDSPKQIPAPAETVQLMEFIDSGPISQKQIRAWTRADPVLCRVLELTRNGWDADTGDVTGDLRPYRNRQAELSVENDCVLWGGRVVIPPQGRDAMLCQLHEGHFGVARMKSFGRMYFWWPGLDKDVERIAAECPSCQSWRNAAPQTPLHPWEWPRAPWQRLHIDYCGPVDGWMLLLVVDAHSKWMDVHKTKTASAEATIEKLRDSFACHGIPETVVSDNARCFDCPIFKTFCKQNGVRHVTSPPYSPHSNGLVERAVQTLKQGLQRQSTGSLSTRLSRFLFRYRSMPHSVTQRSPAEMLFGRRMRTQLDLLRQDGRRGEVEAYQARQKIRYDEKAQARTFDVGDPVYMFVLPQPAAGPKWLPGVVRQADGCSCWIELFDGRSFRRHFDHVRHRHSRVPDVMSPQHGRHQLELPIAVQPTTAAVDGAGGASSSPTDDPSVPDAVAGSSPASADQPLTRSSTPPPPTEPEVVLRRSGRSRFRPDFFQAGQTNLVVEGCGDLGVVTHCAP